MGFLELSVLFIQTWRLRVGLLSRAVRLLFKGISMYRTFDSLHHAYELLNRRIRTLLTHFGQKLNHFCFNWDSWQIKLILSLKIEAFSKFDLSIFIESSNDVLFIRQFFGFWFKFFFIILDPSSNFPHQTIEFIFEVIFGPPFHFQANSDPFGPIIKIFF